MDKEVDLLFFKYLKQIRNNLSMLMDIHVISSLELSKKVGISYGAVHNILNCKSNPTIDTISKIAHYFNVSMIQLMGDLPILENNKSLSARTIPILEWEEDLKCLKKERDIAQINNSPYKVLVSSNKYDFNELSFGIISHEKYEPIFIKGSLLVFNSANDNFSQYDGKYILMTASEYNFEISLKKLLIADGDFYLQSLIPNMPLKLMPKDCIIHGVLIQIKTEF